ncbi:hypothetical protein KM043_018204 [Ampulex compressa]|nr:hypothetical protein KM043_018204 [Ampulex compressa]
MVTRDVGVPPHDGPIGTAAYPHHELFLHLPTRPPACSFRSRLLHRPDVFAYWLKRQHAEQRDTVKARRVCSFPVDIAAIPADFGSGSGITKRHQRRPIIDIKHESDPLESRTRHVATKATIFRISVIEQAEFRVHF